ncbi:MAG TPA: hypothetical protein VFL96_08390 [Acidobacteriaceae bacterium]|nr:hypothetical protein [Acidobacteriaceae bacterium]
MARLLSLLLSQHVFSCRGHHEPDRHRQASGLEPFAWLSDTTTRMSTTRDRDIETLLPLAQAIGLTSHKVG